MTKLQSIGDSANGVHRYDLKGYERGLRVTAKGCTRVAHALQVTCPVDAVVQDLARAFRLVLNRHPKTRVLMSKDPNEPMTSYVQPPFASNADVDSMVTVVSHRSLTQERQLDVVRELIQEVCNEEVDRTTQYPYCLRAYVHVNPCNDTEGKLTLVLFSDHAFGDGYSGMIVLNDLLVNVRLLIKLAQTNVGSHDHVALTKQLEANCEQLPLRPSLYDQLIGSPTFWKTCTERVINIVGRMLLPSEIRKFRPLLPSREGLADMKRLPFPVNPTFCLMDSGTKETLHSALKTCRRENVTLHGAIVACVLMAHVKAKYDDIKAIPKSNFKISLDVDYNMRRRTKSPFPEWTVGSNADVASLHPLASRGVDLSRRFWDIARYSKQLTDDSLSSFLSYTEMIFCHNNFHSKNTKWSVPINKGVVRDVNISNLGRYPFATVHELGELGSIQVNDLHLYNSSPHIGYNAIVFVTSVEHLDYTMAHKLSDTDGETLFRYIVQSIEAISSIGENETMLQACERI